MSLSQATPPGPHTTHTLLKDSIGSATMHVRVGQKQYAENMVQCVIAVNEHSGAIGADALAWLLWWGQP